MSLTKDYILKTCYRQWVWTKSGAAKSMPGFSRIMKLWYSTGTFFQISGWTDSMGTILYEEERIHPGYVGNILVLTCIAAISPKKQHHQHCSQQCLQCSASGILIHLHFNKRLAIKYRNFFFIIALVLIVKTFTHILWLTCTRPPLIQNISLPLIESLVQIFATTTKIYTCSQLYLDSCLRCLWSLMCLPTHHGIDQVHTNKVYAFLTATVQHISYYTFLF